MSGGGNGVTAPLVVFVGLLSESTLSKQPSEDAPGARPRYICKKTIRKKIKVIVFLLMWRAVTLFPPSFVGNYLLSGKQAFRLQLIADLTGAFGYLLGTKIP